MTWRPDVSALKTRAALRTLAVLAVAGAVVGLVVGLVAPRWYRSTATVMPASAPKTSGLSSLLGGEVASLAAGLGSVVGGNADVSRIGAVLQSAAVADGVIEKLDLKARYDAKFPETAREILWKHCELRTLPKPGLVQLSCEDQDPAFAQSLVRQFSELGNQAFGRISAGSATEEVRYLERRIAELRRAADEAATRQREFQEKHGLVDMEGQARALVSSLSTLYGQRVAKQMELDYARTFTSGDEPGTRQLEAQLSVIDEQLRDLEAPRAGKGGAGRPAGRGASLPAAGSVPALRTEAERLYRDRRVAEASLVFALDRLEGARAAAARDVSTFVVVDPATLPTRKARPLLRETVAIGAVVGLLVGVAVVLWRRRKDGVGPA